MPIEIKELHIKINVDESTNSKQTMSANGMSNAGNEEEVIAQCIEAVMELIENKQER